MNLPPQAVLVVLWLMWWVADAAPAARNDALAADLDRMAEMVRSVRGPHNRSAINPIVPWWRSGTDLHNPRLNPLAVKLAEALGEKTLSTILREADPRSASFAAVGLGAIDSDGAREALKEALATRQKPVVNHALNAVAYMADEGVVDSVIRLLSDADRRQIHTGHALCSLVVCHAYAPRTVNKIRTFLEGHGRDEPARRRQVLQTLVSMGEHETMVHWALQERDAKGQLALEARSFLLRFYDSDRELLQLQKALHDSGGDLHALRKAMAQVAARRQRVVPGMPGAGRQADPQARTWRAREARRYGGEIHRLVNRREKPGSPAAKEKEKRVLLLIRELERLRTRAAKVEAILQEVVKDTTESKKVRAAAKTLLETLPRKSQD